MGNKREKIDGEKNPEKRAVLRYTHGFCTVAPRPVRPTKAGAVKAVIATREVDRFCRATRYVYNCI